VPSWFSRVSFGGFLPQQAYKRLRITNRLTRRVPPQPGVYHKIGPYIPVLKERGFTTLLVKFLQSVYRQESGPVAAFCSACR
jgi:hypothetical protein